MSNGSCFTVKNKQTKIKQLFFFMSLVSGQLPSESVRICATLAPMKLFPSGHFSNSNMFSQLSYVPDDICIIKSDF